MARFLCGIQRRYRSGKNSCRSCSKNEGNLDYVSDGWAVGDSDILVVGSVDGTFDG